MNRIAPSLAATLAVALGGSARADDFLAHAAVPMASAAKPAPAATGDSSSWLALGAEAGIAPILAPPGGPVAPTTATSSASIFARISLPILSSRIEIDYVPSHGEGATLETGNLTLGPVGLHLLDLGLFYDRSAPITVARVARSWDVAVGAGAELALGRHITIVADARWFAPLDLWGVVTRYGDTARLIGDEVIHGGQLWAGAAWRF
jgi:hypothetical protein